MSEVFVREILSLYVVGAVGAVVVLPAWVDWMMKGDE